MVARLFAVRPASPASLAAAAGRGCPGHRRYRVDQTLTQDIDATAAGKGKQTISFSTSSFVTLTLTDSAGGKSGAHRGGLDAGRQRHADSRRGVRQRAGAPSSTPS